MADGRGGTESDRIFDRIWTIGIIGGVLARSGLLRKKKKPKYEVPKEGTPEFEEAVRQGKIEAIKYFIAVVIGLILTFWKQIKSLFE